MSGARARWVPAAVLAGFGYLAIGRLFPNPAVHAQAWRLGAWALSAVLFAAHIAFERFRLRNAPPALALHAALAVGLGGFLLAVAASVHSHRLMPLALLLWPVITAVPAFLAALVAGWLLARLAPAAP